MARRSDPNIPRSALREGIIACLSVAYQRVFETEKLLAQGLLEQAGIVFSFAIEEFGKAALLREAFESGADPVTIEGFYDHRVKHGAAARHVPPTVLRLTEGGFGPGGFDPGGFDTGRPADLAARMAGLYVEWDGKWVYGLEVGIGALMRSSFGFRSVIEQALQVWPEE